MLTLNRLISGNKFSNRLKELLCLTSILAHPDFLHNVGRFILDTDANDPAVGPALSHVSSTRKKSYCVWKPKVT